jgi:hypothetical protein
MGVARMPWAKVTPRIDPAVRGLCRKPYPGHPGGCPNYSRKDGCPPGTRLLGDDIDLSRPVYAIYNAFPLGEHVAKMRARHPEWTNRQLRCCLYWQPRARKSLRHEIDEFFAETRRTMSVPRSWVVARCPEAQGVDMTATMGSAGIVLEWPPVNVAYQVVLIGSPQDGASPAV